MISRLTRRILLLGFAAWLSACGGKTPTGAALMPGAAVLALGDSITYGTGAPPEASYPAVLARLTGWNVVNAGVPGNVSAQALERQPDLLQQHAPALVLLSIGGNDLLRQLPEAAIRENIRQTVAQARAGGAQVLLIAVPRPSAASALIGSLNDHPMYEDLAKELGLPLHAKGWSKVLSHSSLRSDAIHANAAGYDVFARGLADTLRERGFLTSR